MILYIITKKYIWKRRILARSFLNYHPLHLLSWWVQNVNFLTYQHPDTIFISCWYVIWRIQVGQSISSPANLLNISNDSVELLNCYSRHFLQGSWWCNKKRIKLNFYESSSREMQPLLGNHNFPMTLNMTHFAEM